MQPEPKQLEPKWLEPKWLEPKWLRIRVPWLRENKSSVVGFLLVLSKPTTLVCACAHIRRNRL